MPKRILSGVVVSSNSNKTFINTTSSSITIGTTELNFSQFSIGGVTSITSGTGITGSGVSGDLTIQLSDNIIKSSLGKIGTAADQEYITFGTSNEINTFINNTERLSVTNTGADITGNVSINNYNSDVFDRENKNLPTIKETTENNSRIGNIGTLEKN